MDQDQGASRGAVYSGFSESVTDSFVSYANNWVKYETTNPRYVADHDTGEYLTTREAMDRAGKEVPDYAPSPDMRYLVADFWNLKRYLPEISAPITPGLVRDYMECQGALLTRAERAIIYATDYALRGALADQIAKNERWKMKQARKK